MCVGTSFWCTHKSHQGAPRVLAFVFNWGFLPNRNIENYIKSAADPSPFSLTLEGAHRILAWILSYFLFNSWKKMLNQSRGRRDRLELFPKCRRESGSGSGSESHQNSNENKANWIHCVQWGLYVPWDIKQVRFSVSFKAVRKTSAKPLWVRLLQKRN